MKFNGQNISLNERISLLKLLQQNSYDISKIAVELNGDIVPKVKYADTMLLDEDTLEVVSFIGGG
ncbi:MAG TPA: sulfur carrier protein ThiS [Bacteroidales bacterium]|nr:sulfur carrier protein ThiS [Bacteroidales bacterium]